MTGRLIAVVGLSGVGKDNVIAGINEAMPQLQMTRRITTHAPDPRLQNVRRMHINRCQRGWICAASAMMARLPKQSRRLSRRFNL